MHLQRLSCIDCILIYFSEFVDYTPINVTLLFVNGTTRGGDGSRICTEIEIVDNGLIELTEYFTVTADSSDPNVNSTLITATVMVLDDEREYVLYKLWCLAHQLTRVLNSTCCG